MLNKIPKHRRVVRAVDEQKILTLLAEIKAAKVYYISENYRSDKHPDGKYVRAEDVEKLIKKLEEL